MDVTATKDRLGNWSYAGYNQIRQMVAETNANGVITRYGFCDCGALLSVTNAWNTRVEHFGYSARGLVAYTNQLGYTNYYAYDEVGRKMFETNSN